MFLLNRFFATLLLFAAIAKQLNSKEDSNKKTPTTYTTKKTFGDFHIFDEVTPLMKACQEGDAELSKVKQLIKRSGGIVEKNNPLPSCSF